MSYPQSLLISSTKTIFLCDNKDVTLCFFSIFPGQNVYHIWLNVKNKHKQRSKKSKMGQTSLFKFRRSKPFKLEFWICKTFERICKGTQQCHWGTPHFNRIYAHISFRIDPEYRT